jgi:hypothetical protein
MKQYYMQGSQYDTSRLGKTRERKVSYIHTSIKMGNEIKKNEMKSLLKRKHK